MSTNSGRKAVSIGIGKVALLGREVTTYRFRDGRRMVAFGPLARAAGESSLRMLEELQRLPPYLRGQIARFYSPDGIEVLGVPVGWISELAALEAADVPAKLAPLWERAREAAAVVPGGDAA